MDTTYSIQGLSLFITHLDNLFRSVSFGDSTPLRIDIALFEDIERQLDGHTIPLVVQLLLPKLLILLRTPLPSTEEESRAAAKFASKLMLPFSWHDLCQFITLDDILQALHPSAPPATNVMALMVLRKMAVPGPGFPETVEPLRQLSQSPQLITALIQCWLSSPSTAVGENGLRTIGDLLDADCIQPNGLVGRRMPILRDEEPEASDTPHDSLDLHNLLIHSDSDDQPMVNGNHAVNGNLARDGASPTSSTRFASPTDDTSMDQRVSMDSTDSRASTGSRVSSVSMNSSGIILPIGPVPEGLLEYVRPPREIPGPGFLWPCVVQPGGTYQRLIISLCNHNTHGIHSLPPLQRSVAQCRLMRLVPRLAALDPDAFVSTDQSMGIGLLSFVAHHMVDHQDQLVYRHLIDFFQILFRVLAFIMTTNNNNGIRNPESVTASLRLLLNDAAAKDPTLLDRVRSLPDYVPLEEAEGLRAWLPTIMPTPELSDPEL